MLRGGDASRRPYAAGCGCRPASAVVEEVGVDVALVTGNLTGELAGIAAGIDEPYVAALTDRGVRVHTPGWRDPEVDWGRFDVAVVRTPWDYPYHRDEFVSWGARAGAATTLWNPADVLRWNSHKSYLLELEERGAPVVPTAWMARGDRVGLADLLAARSWTRAVVKPAVASGSEGLIRVGAGAATAGSAGRSGGGPGGTGGTGGAGGTDADVDLARAQGHLDRLLEAGDVMVQPYLDAVERDGEMSVVLIDGEPTHAVRKTPPTGEFRIQEQYGGRYARVDLATDAAEPAALARWIVEAAAQEFLYARVDLLRDDDGAWQLAELEVTEPDLYLTVAPEVATVLAEATLARG